jgi:hypothetical protein
MMLDMTDSWVGVTSMPRGELVGSHGDAEPDARLSLT